ncbi:MAG TPA: helix-turn-helix transcriptional regulator [Candidatus Faecisoma merdavium]|nr:helix-turn-helix transcriptional regulator [Candidatus Faecisoma merdavium]
MKIDKSNNKYIYVIVGKNIKRIRKAKGLTQVQLADLIQYNEGTIANIENDSFQTFSLEFLYILSKKLNVPIEEFFKGLH